MISNLSDSELHAQTVTASNEEKNASHRLLAHLNETEKRRSYLALGYHSLWSYVEHDLGYSHAQTSERVASVTTIKAVPEALDAIARKTLSITTAAQIGRTIRYEKKSVEEASALFKECDGKSSREIERILLPPASDPKPDRVRAVSKTTTSIQIEVDEEFMALAKRAMEMSGDFSMKSVLKRALAKVVKLGGIPKKRTGTVVAHSEGSSEGRAPNPKSPPPAESLPMEHPIPQDRYIPSDSRRTVRNRSGDRCEYASRETRNRCVSRANLEFHHLKPYAHFGNHQPENLMHVCRSHHAFLERRRPAAAML